MSTLIDTRSDDERWRDRVMEVRETMLEQLFLRYTRTKRPLPTDRDVRLWSREIAEWRDEVARRPPERVPLRMRDLD